MEEGGTAVTANYINLNRCATTPWMLVLIFELLKILSWMVTRTGNALPRVQRAQLGKGRDVYGFSLETVYWGQILQRAKCSHNLFFNGNVKPEGTYMEWRDLLPLCITPLCSLLKSWTFLGTACVLRWPRCMQRDAGLAGATEQYQRQHPFRKGEASPAGLVPGNRCQPFLGVAQPRVCSAQHYPLVGHRWKFRLMPVSRQVELPVEVLAVA